MVTGFGGQLPGLCLVPLRVRVWAYAFQSEIVYATNLHMHQSQAATAE